MLPIWKNSDNHKQTMEFGLRREWALFKKVHISMDKN